MSEPYDYMGDTFVKIVDRESVKKKKINVTPTNSVNRYKPWKLPCVETRRVIKL